MIPEWDCSDCSFPSNNILVFIYKVYSSLDKTLNAGLRKGI